jgi:Sulfotransferase domain
MKIFSLGINQTGTTIMGACLRHWGFRHISFYESTYAMWEKADTKTLFALASRSQRFEDWLWVWCYRELDEVFPDSRYLLTRTRSSPDFLCAHGGRTGPTRLCEVVYGHTMPHRYRDEQIQFCESHLQEVRHYFRNHLHDLLDVCREEEDDWKALANFLGTAVPDTPFPHA